MEINPKEHQTSQPEKNENQEEKEWANGGNPEGAEDQREKETEKGKYLSAIPFQATVGALIVIAVAGAAAYSLR
mgnify:CR=1 FL=1